MVHNDPISLKTLNAVAEQIASAVESGIVISIPRSTLTPLSLGRTLAVWGLKPRVVEAVGEGFNPRTLDDWARPLNRWHHQIKIDRNSSAFARSLSSPAESVEPPAEESVASLRQLAVSPKAEKIEQGIKWVEQNPQRDPGSFGLSAPYEPLVRLLETSAYRTTALLLVVESEGSARVLVVDSPTRNKGPQEGQFFEPAEFLKTLSAVSIPRGIT